MMACLCCLLWAPVPISPGVKAQATKGEKGGSSGEEACLTSQEASQSGHRASGSQREPSSAAGGQIQGWTSEGWELD